MQDRIAQETQGRRRMLRIAGASAACVVALAVASASPIAGQTPTTHPADTTGSRTPTVPARPYFEFQVEKPVRLASGSPNPAYPAELKAAKVSGVVLAQFVVDTLGRAEVSTFKVLKSDHQLFTEAVKNTLPDLRFIPAEVGGRKVKQLVQQPFTFATNKSVIGPVEIPNPRRPDSR